MCAPDDLEKQRYPSAHNSETNHFADSRVIPNYPKNRNFNNFNRSKMVKNGQKLALK